MKVDFLKPAEAKLAKAIACSAVIPYVIFLGLPQNLWVNLPAVPAAQPLQAGRQAFPPKADPMADTTLHGAPFAGKLRWAKGTEKKRLLEIRLCQTQSLILSRLFEKLPKNTCHSSKIRIHFDCYE